MSAAPVLAAAPAFQLPARGRESWELTAEQVRARRQGDPDARAVHLWAIDGKGARCRSFALLDVEAPRTLDELFWFTAHGRRHVTATWATAIVNCHACLEAPAHGPPLPRRRIEDRATLDLFGGAR